MSRQQFFDPEQQPDEGTYSEAGFYEHHEEHGEYAEWPQSAEYNGPASERLTGEKIRPVRPRRSLPMKVGALLVLAILLVSGIALGAPFSHRPPWEDHDRPFPFLHGKPLQTFSVNGPVQLTIKDSDGAIRVHQGDTNQVIIFAVSHHGPDFRSNTLSQAAQNGNTITINANTDEEDGDNSGVYLDITTPRTTSVNIQSDSASIDVEGLQGQLNAQTDSGSIITSNDNGVLNLRTSSGHINATNDVLNGQSSLRTEDGEINFIGAIDPHGSYQFEAGDGTINVTLPADSSPNIIASSSGNIHNDFANSGAGNSSQANVSIHTGDGSINIRKAGD